MSKSDLLTSSAWIRENMQYDIIYLTGSLDQIRIAEYTAAEPENSEKNRLCINYSGSLDGKWMTDLYGCQSMDMFAMADFTRTGALTIAYKKSWEVLPTYLSQCGPGYTFDQCTHTLVASCITPGQHIVGYHGSCRDPRAYSLPEWT